MQFSATICPSDKLSNHRLRQPVRPGTALAETPQAKAPSIGVFKVGVQSDRWCGPGPRQASPQVTRKLGGKQVMRKLPILFLFVTAASLLLGACGSNVEESAGTLITADQLAHRIQAGSPPLVLDVRTREEYAQGHIPGAINIPHDELPTRLAELPIAKSEEVVVHCQSGGRARLAEEALRGSGYSNVLDLEGHWRGWQGAGLPTE